MIRSSDLIKLLNFDLILDTNRALDQHRSTQTQKNINKQNQDGVAMILESEFNLQR